MKNKIKELEQASKDRKTITANRHVIDCVYIGTLELSGMVKVKLFDSGEIVKVDINEIEII